MNEPNGILVLPPHYMQLAAALGLSTRPIVDSVSTRTDFERLIEINRTHVMPPSSNIVHSVHVTAAYVSAKETDSAQLNCSLKSQTNLTTSSSSPSVVTTANTEKDDSKKHHELQLQQQHCPPQQQQGDKSIQKFQHQNIQGLQSFERGGGEQQQLDESMWRPW